MIMTTLFIKQKAQSACTANLIFKYVYVPLHIKNMLFVIPERKLKQNVLKIISFLHHCQLEAGQIHIKK